MRRLISLLALLGTLALATDPPAALAQTPAEVEALLWAAAQRHGVNYWWLRRVAWCESSLRPWATSPTGHAGLFQFSWRTWAWMSAAAGRAGASPYDPEAAADVAAHAFACGRAHHWSCR